ncbi:MAG: DUF1513 domain-containing protein [Pseudomonadota bacterium]
MTYLTRRSFVTGLGGTMALAGVPPPMGVAASRREFWVSAQGDGPQRYGLAWIDTDGQSPRSLPSGFRGHAVIQHGLRRESVVMLARRPGTRGIEIDLATGRTVRDFECGQSRHLFGHGCFSNDGSVLFTSEADIKAGVGKIVVRDASDYRVLDEWSSYGIGPHELALLPDGNTLVVANGGILTRPDSGRQRLNILTMRSSLAYLDSSSGKRIDQFEMAEPKASIRHLDVASDGSVAFAIQLQRDAAGHNRPVPLAGVQRPGEGLTLFDAPESLLHALRDYIGSVAVCHESRIAAFASPRGSLAAFWDLDTDELLGYHRLRDVCGLAFSPQRKAFVLSNSFGEMRELDATTLDERRSRRTQHASLRWDNHLTVISG